MGKGCLGKNLGQRPEWSEREPCRYLGKGVPRRGNSQGRGVE